MYVGFCLIPLGHFHLWGPYSFGKVNALWEFIAFITIYVLKDKFCLVQYVMTYSSSQKKGDISVPYHLIWMVIPTISVPVEFGFLAPCRMRTIIPFCSIRMYMPTFHN